MTSEEDYAEFDAIRRAAEEGADAADELLYIFRAIRNDPGYDEPYKLKWYPRLSAEQLADVTERLRDLRVSLNIIIRHA